MAEAAATIVVRSQLIVLEGMRLVLPNTAIAEVIAHAEPEPVDNMPEWFLGYSVWRGQRIPIISFEMMQGYPAPNVNRRSRIIVINTITGGDERPFYGLLAAAIPRLMALDSSAIIDDGDQSHVAPLLMRQVLIDNQSAFIPDQHKIEEMLEGHNIRVTPAD
ncbi:MAG: chemotaxis protein CheW [Gammaproteobacteria bacterium]|nr:chemotaxis protein CheW [Gammaproteobacteria bacterium]